MAATLTAEVVALANCLFQFRGEFWRIWGIAVAVYPTMALLAANAFVPGWLASVIPYRKVERIVAMCVLGWPKQPIQGWYHSATSTSAGNLRHFGNLSIPCRSMPCLPLRACQGSFWIDSVVRRLVALAPFLPPPTINAEAFTGTELAVSVRRIGFK